MKRIPLLAGLALAGSLLAQPGVAADEGPYVLKELTLVCASPDAYQQGLDAVAAASNKRETRKQLLEERVCMTIDDDAIEVMLPPFLMVRERQGDMVKVQFKIEHYKRIHFLHRKFAHVTYEGWTHQNRIIPRSALGQS